MENFNGVNFLLQVMVWKTNFDADYGDVVKPQKYGSSVDGTHGTGVGQQPVIVESSFSAHFVQLESVWLRWLNCRIIFPFCLFELQDTCF